MSSVEQSEVEEQRLLAVESGKTEVESHLGTKQRFRVVFVAPVVLMGLLAFAVFPSTTPAKPSDSLQMSYDIYGSFGPQAFDIHQGVLGSCYALAGFAAIAKTYPHIINNAFVDQVQWLAKEPVISSKWYIGGEPMTVAVDDMIPVQGLDFTFARLPTAAREIYHLWPTVLEKAFAKINGAYWSINFGNTHEILLGLTGAPIGRGSFDTKPCVDQWSDMTKFANELKYPIVFGVTKKPQDCLRSHCYVPGQHAYAFLGTEIKVLPNGTEVKVAKVYNPHGHIRGYNGALQGQTDVSGEFYMLYNEEFCHDAHYYDVAYVPSSEHRVSYQSVNLKAGRAEANYKFNITKPGLFFIMVRYLQDRVRKERFGCSNKDVTPAGGMLVKTPSGELKEYQFIPEYQEIDWGVYGDFQEAGAYEVYLFVAFKDAVLPKIALDVYAAEDVTFEEVPMGNGQDLCTRQEGCRDLIKQFKEQMFSDSVPIKCNLNALQHAEDFLNNVQQIQKDGYDEHFPANMSSISQNPRSGCGGDTAGGIGMASCESYNVWESLRDVMKARNEEPEAPAKTGQQSKQASKAGRPARQGRNQKIQ